MLWKCSINRKDDEISGTVVDYHWSINGAPSYGYVSHKDDTQEIIISWRGSTVLMDWIADFSFAAVPWPSSLNGSMVHTGFLGAYKGAAENIKAAVDNLVQKYPDYKIVLTGHSLGGAEAALAAVDFAIEHPEWISKIEVYTYGAPRVGNSVFANWLSSQPFPIFRVVNQSDIVPQVPLRVLGYQHHAQEVWYNTNGQLNFCGSNGEGASGQNSLTALQMRVLTHLQYPGLGYEVWYLFVGSLKVIF